MRSALPSSSQSGGGGRLHDSMAGESQALVLRMDPRLPGGQNTRGGRSPGSDSEGWGVGWEHGLSRWVAQHRPGPRGKREHMAHSRTAPSGCSTGRETHTQGSFWKSKWVRGAPGCISALQLWRL